MRSGLLALAVLCGPALGGAAAAGESCPALLGEAGEPSDLDGCALEELVTRADLRSHLSACVRRALEVDLPPPARLEFRLALHPGGGAERLELVGGGGAGLLGRCTLRVLGTRFVGGRDGRPALIEGWLRLAPGEPARFSFGLAAAARAARPQPAPLPGAFRDSPGGPVSVCSLGGRRLVVRLGGGGEAEPAAEAGPVDPRVAACLAEAPSAKPPRGRPAPKPVRPEVCLEELLRAPRLELRAAAAEELARRRSWRSRRAIERSLLASLQPPGAPGAGAERATPAAQAEPARPLAAPADERAALAALRLLESALALYRQPEPEVLEALAAHPSAAVRGRLLAGALERWRGEAGGALRSLSRAPEPLLRARAQQLGCLRGEPQSLHAFREDLSHPEPAVRAQAVLLARACARRSAPEVLSAAAREPAGPVALLLLQAAPMEAEAEAEVRRLAPAALSATCPATRFLAAHLLARLAAPPREPVLAALERERDPVLRQGLEALLREPAGRPPAPTAQVWLQDGSDADPSGARALPSEGHFE